MNGLLNLGISSSQIAMSHFNLKSLIFYGVAIGSVALLFKNVSAFGESNLKAPASINGRYAIVAKNFPGCLKTDLLFLDIQQSGIYLNGALLTANKTAKSKLNAVKKPSIAGKLNKQNLFMSGAIPQLNSCQNQSLTIQGQIEKTTLKGEIIISSVPKAVKFTAKKEASAQSEKPSESH
jgi:hypothetical protein